MREWLVIRLGRPEDTSKGRVGSNAQAPEGQGIRVGGGWADAVQVAPRARPRNRNEDLADMAMQIAVAPGQQQVPPQAVGYGYYAKPADRDDKSGSLTFTTEEAAVEYAQELAAKQPQVLFGVFSCNAVFETAAPKVLKKRFNDGGELVMEEVGNVPDSI